MKLYGFLTALVVAIVPLALHAEEVRLDVAFDVPVHTSTPFGDVLEVPGADLLARPGEPLLPRKTFTFVLPQGHTSKQLRLEAIRTETLAGRYDIAPAQRPVPLSARFTPRITPPDASIYASGNPHPGEWATTGSVQYKHGFALVQVTVHPLSYRPVSGEVIRLRSATLVLTTRPGGAVSGLLRAAPGDEAAVTRRADVAAAARTYSRRVTRGPLQLEPGDYPYLIVTPEIFVGLVGEYSLEALRDAREALGMPANIVTLEWIRANYDGYRPDGDQDDATRIRDFLTDAYLEWNTSYVLLVGDADAGDNGGESGDDLLQVRKLWVDTGHPEAAGDHLPADIYYSCLDGSFDHDADGVYGEYSDGPDGGEVDLMAELYVGRAPVDSTEEVYNFVAKTLAYEAGAGAWLKEVWMVGELLWDQPSEVWAGDALDELIDGSSAGGYTTLGFSSFSFFECYTLYDRDMAAGTSWGTSDLMTILDAGPHIVNHLGHSNVTYNMRLMNHNVDALINVHPFLHYSQGCYNGAFDNSVGPDQGNAITIQDCIAEHMVAGRHGAFATISNSRYGWGSFMTNGPSQRFHREYWDAFFGEGMGTIGEALVDSKEDNASAFSDAYIRWVGFESNLLGDPAVALKKSINTTDPLLGIYPPQLEFIAMIGEGAPPAATVVVRNDGVGSLSFTSSADQSWVILSPESGDAPADLLVEVDPTGLQPGTHQALITFESAEAANSPMKITVVFILVEVPDILVPHIMQVPTVDGVIDSGEYDQALSLAIDPYENGDVTLYLAVAGSKLFIGVDDRLDPAESDWDRMMLYFDRNQDALWPTAPAEDGVYILISRDGGMIMFVPVYNPGSGVQMDFRNRESNPPGFDGVIGFVDNHRVYEVSLDLDVSHIDVGPTGAFGMYLEVQNSEQMGGGTRTGSWPPVVPETDDQRYFGRVDMLPGEAWLHASPGSIYFEAVAEREAPTPVSLSVLELLGGNVDFTAGSSVGWLEVTPPSGQTPLDLTVSADQASLTPGTHSGAIVLESTQTGNSQLRVPVTFEVLPVPARLSVSPTNFDVTAAEDDPDPESELLVENLGGRDMNVLVTPSQDWLTTTPAAFVVAPGGREAVEVQIALSGLELGIHQAEILVEAPDAEDSPVTVPLQLELLRANSAPPIPQLLSPANGAELSVQVELTAMTVVDPELDPVTYNFELRVPSSDQPLDEGTGVEGVGYVGFKPTVELEENILYRWRVEAVDDLGASSGYSEEWTFSIVPEPGSDGCGCAHSRAASIGLAFCLLGLLAIRFKGGARTRAD